MREKKENKPIRTYGVYAFSRFSNTKNVRNASMHLQHAPTHSKVTIFVH